MWENFRRPSWKFAIISIWITSTFIEFFYPFHMSRGQVPIRFDRWCPTEKNLGNNTLLTTFSPVLASPISWEMMSIQKIINSKDYQFKGLSDSLLKDYHHWKQRQARTNRWKIMVLSVLDSMFLIFVIVVFVLDSIFVTIVRIVFVSDSIFVIIVL